MVSLPLKVGCAGSFEIKSEILEVSGNPRSEIPETTKSCAESFEIKSEILESKALALDY